MAEPDFKIGQVVRITERRFDGQLGTITTDVRDNDFRGDFLVCTTRGATLGLFAHEIRLADEPEIEGEPISQASYWQTPEGRLNLAIRAGLRESGIDDDLERIVGPVMRHIRLELDRRYREQWSS